MLRITVGQKNCVFREETHGLKHQSGYVALSLELYGEEKCVDVYMRVYDVWGIKGFRLLGLGLTFLTNPSGPMSGEC